ncbi:MAG: zinc ribbon domain-containing protein [Pseudomonadota bacterium]
MRCSECRTNISPGPEFCPACGGDLDITAKELISWSFRSAYRGLSTVAGWTLAFAGIVGVSLVGSLVDLDETRLTVFVSPDPSAEVAVLSDPAVPAPVLNTITPVCDGDCEAEVEMQARPSNPEGYVLRRRSDLPMRSEADLEEALQLRETAAACVTMGAAQCAPTP